MDPLVFIVPLGFLAIWAITHIFNRDSNPLTARNPNALNPYAARTATPTRPSAPRPIETPSAARPSPPPLRWAPQNVTARRAPSPGGDDDIIILDSPRTTSSPNQGKGVGPARKARQKPPAAPKHTPSVRPKLGFEGVSQNVNQQLTSPLALSPLSEQSGPSSVQSVGTASAMPMTSTNPKARTISIMAALSDPARVREAMLVNELLQPPLALRGSRR